MAITVVVVCVVDKRRTFPFLVASFPPEKGLAMTASTAQIASTEGQPPVSVRRTFHLTSKEQLEFVLFLRFVFRVDDTLYAGDDRRRGYSLSNRPQDGFGNGRPTEEAIAAAYDWFEHLPEAERHRLIQGVPNQGYATREGFTIRTPYQDRWSPETGDTVVIAPDWYWYS